MPLGPSSAQRLRKLLCDVGLFFLRDPRKAGKREAMLGEMLRGRKIATPVAEVMPRRLQMNRRRIVDRGADAAGSQRGEHLVAVLDLDDEQVVDLLLVLAVRHGERQRQIGEQLAVERCRTTALLVGLMQSREAKHEQGGLEVVEPMRAPLQPVPVWRT